MSAVYPNQQLQLQQQLQSLQVTAGNNEDTQATATAPTGFAQQQHQMNFAANASSGSAGSSNSGSGLVFGAGGGASALNLNNGNNMQPLLNLVQHPPVPQQEQQPNHQQPAPLMMPGALGSLPPAPPLTSSSSGANATNSANSTATNLFALQQQQQQPPQQQQHLAVGNASGVGNASTTSASHNASVALMGASLTHGNGSLTNPPTTTATAAGAAAGTTPQQQQQQQQQAIGGGNGFINNNAAQQVQLMPAPPLSASQHHFLTSSQNKGSASTSINFGPGLSQSQTTPLNSISSPGGMIGQQNQNAPLLSGLQSGSISSSSVASPDLQQIQQQQAQQPQYQQQAQQPQYQQQAPLAPATVVVNATTGEQIQIPLQPQQHQQQQQAAAGLVALTGPNGQIQFARVASPSGTAMSGSNTASPFVPSQQQQFSPGASLTGQNLQPQPMLLQQPGAAGAVPTQPQSQYAIINGQAHQIVLQSMTPQPQQAGFAQSGHIFAQSAHVSPQLQLPQGQPGSAIALQQSPQQQQQLQLLAHQHHAGASTGHQPSGSMHSHSQSHASTSSRPLANTGHWGFAVVDPYHTTLQRVPIAPSAVSMTRGVTTYNNDVSLSSTKPCTSHVCVKYISSLGCSLGEQCANFHVRADYLEKARRVVDPICCGLHNDYFTREMLRSRCAAHMIGSKFTLVLDDRSEVELLPSHLAFTVGLEQLSIRGNARIINLRKQICRLHVEGKCKWTKDCGHVHMCRELHKFLASFHYPSLVFLLSTETSAERLSTKLREGSKFLDFLRSKCAVHLIYSMLAGERTEAAVKALVSVGACMTRGMAAVAKTRFGITVPWSQIFAESDVIDMMLQQPGGCGSCPNILAGVDVDAVMAPPTAAAAATASVGAENAPAIAATAATASIVSPSDEQAKQEQVQTASTVQATENNTNVESAVVQE